MQSYFSFIASKGMNYVSDNMKYNNNN